jgi:hypothetical protein
MSLSREKKSHVTKKSDRIAARLAKIVDEEKSRKTALDLLQKILGWAEDPILERAKQLRDAVTLRADETALRKAFQAFDMNPNIPDHWHRLINYFARAHFEPNRPGARTKWTPTRRVQLLRDVRSVAKRLSTNDFSTIASEIIANRSYDRSLYDGMNVESLVRQIYHAIDWINDGLKQL